MMVCDSVVAKGRYEEAERALSSPEPATQEKFVLFTSSFASLEE